MDRDCTVGARECAVRAESAREAEAVRICSNLSKSECTHLTVKDPEEHEKRGGAGALPDGSGNDEGCSVYVLAQNLELQVTLGHKPLL
jgi:hypothetical protein